jgi:hypothetical protein
LFHPGARIFVRRVASPNPSKGGAFDDTAVCSAVHNLIVLIPGIDDPFTVKIAAISVFILLKRNGVFYILRKLQATNETTII